MASTHKRKHLDLVNHGFCAPLVCLPEFLLYSSSFLFCNSFVTFFLMQKHYLESPGSIRQKSKQLIKRSDLAREGRCQHMSERSGTPVN